MCESRGRGVRDNKIVVIECEIFLLESPIKLKEKGIGGGCVKRFSCNGL